MGPRVAVIGSTVPGLLAGALLARRGARVLLVPTPEPPAAPVAGLEGVPAAAARWPLHPVVDGVRSPLVPLLHELGLPPPHQGPGTWPRYFEHGGRLALAPLNPLALMRSPFLSGRGKRHYVALLFGALRAKAGEGEHEGEGERLDQWMERVEFDEEARGFFRDVAPALSWCADVDDLDAHAYLQTFQAAFRARHRVAHLIGGWDGLAASLAGMILNHGGTVLPAVSPGAPGPGLIVEGNRVAAVRSGSGAVEPVEAAVLAAPPEALPSVVAGTPLAQEVAPAAEAEGAGALVLTLTLSQPMLPPSVSSLFDTARRFLIQDVPAEEWSRAAALPPVDAQWGEGLPTPPDGAQRLQCIAFLRGRNLRSPSHVRGAREGLHAVLDAHAPEWRTRLIDERAALLPRLVPVRPHVGSRGAFLPPRSRHAENVAFVGDSVALPGRLGTAAFTSVRLAVDQFLPAVPPPPPKATRAAWRGPS